MIRCILVMMMIIDSKGSFHFCLVRVIVALIIIIIIIIIITIMRSDSK